MAVNETNMRLWIDALRSGDFTQTKNFLGTPEGNCCLGVACEVAMANGVSIKRLPTVHIDRKVYTYSALTEADGYGPDDSRTHLLAAVGKWLGVKHNAGVDVSLLTEEERARWAADFEVDATFLNDVLEWDFLRIADALEKTYLPANPVEVAE